MPDKKFKKKPRIGKAPDPSDEWNKPEVSWVEGTDKARDLLKKLKDAPGAAWDAYFKFFTDVEKRAGEVHDTILASKRVTEGQMNALNNWAAAVDRAVAKHAPAAEGPP